MRPVPPRTIPDPTVDEGLDPAKPINPISQGTRERRALAVQAQLCHGIHRLRNPGNRMLVSSKLVRHGHLQFDQLHFPESPCSGVRAT
jgi:hypothetical protein